MSSATRGDRQSAYEVRVESAGEVVWDSGRIDSDETVGIEYRGRALRDRQRCSWRVRVWDREGAVSAWSPAAAWEMGIRRWAAPWLAAPWTGDRVAYFQREIFVPADSGPIRVYATALGLYRLDIDGRRVGDDLLRPGYTDYRFRVPYQTYAVDIGPGRHRLTVALAGGWYSGGVAWCGPHNYGQRPMLRVQVEIGGVQQAGDWRVGTGPIRTSDLLIGETYDARRSVGRWRKPSVKAGPDIDIVAWPVAVRRIATLKSRRARGVFDFGQNFAGRVRLRVKGRPGQRVRIRHAEALDRSGRLYTANLRGASSTDVYVCRGGGTEIYEPEFTFHGFRYATADAGTLTGVAISSDLAPRGAFECSEPLFNRLWSAVEWSRRSNFIDVPTDCPQRDERLGWLCDAQLFAGTAGFYANTAAFFGKWLQDVRDAQDIDGAFSDMAPLVPRQLDGEPWPPGAPGWGDAGVIVPWTTLGYDADRRSCERHLASIERWLGYVERHNPSLIWRRATGNDYGDWMADDPSPHDVLATMHFARSADLASRIAAAIGRAAAAKRFGRLRERIRAAFAKEFVASDGRIAGDTQAVYALALAFGLADAGTGDHLARKVEEAGGRLTTGYLSTGHLLPALTAAGRTDLAYRIAMRRDRPSWGFMLDHGATTIWERWDSWTPEVGFQNPFMNSFNHYSLGAVATWLHSTVGGLAFDPSEPGWKRILFAPKPGPGVTSARASFHSIRGPSECRWSIRNGRFTMDVAVPPNTTAEAELPNGSRRGLEPGRHRLSCPYSPPMNE